MHRTCRSRSTGSTRRPGQAGTTFIGQNISTGQALGVNLLEFWNRSVKHIWSLDGSAPGPGPTLTPDLRDRYGTLSHDPGLQYVVATDRVNLIGPVVAPRRGLTVRKIEQHPWRLHDSRATASPTTAGSPGSSDDPVADGTYAYFGPETNAGVACDHRRPAGFCATGAPGTHVTVRVGPLALNEQHAPSVAHATWVKRFVTAELRVNEHSIRSMTPPLAVQVHADPTVRPTRLRRQRIARRSARRSASRSAPKR